ncbi:MAG: oligosaccharide flippase family protein [Lentimicrobiaceae bacterium]|nr:oligosaccharide flippase family protein [Lentimicrobiaceae bacterium]
MNYNKSNTQQALWLAISSFSSLALAFISAAILSRYFDKTEYGTYRQILYVYTTLQTIFTVGLPSVFSYFIPRYSHEEGKYFVNKITQLFLLLGLVFSIVLYTTSGFIAQILNNDELEAGIKIFSVFPLFTLPALGVEGLYTALRETKYVAVYNTISKLLMLVCIVIPVVLFKGDYKTAIIGWGVASFIIFLFALYFKGKPYVGVAKKKIVNFYSTVFDYSVPLMAASLVGFFIASSNQFFISRYYGADNFADFANGFISLPFIGMVGGSIKGVLLPLFSRAQKENKMEQALMSYKSAVAKAVLIVMPLMLFCIVFAKNIVVLIYGDLYSTSAPYFRVSLIRDLFAVLPYASVLLATGHAKIYFKSHLVSAIALLPLSYLFSKLSLSPVLIVVLFVVIEVSRHVYLFYFIYRKEKINLVPSELIWKMIVITAHLAVLLLIIFAISNSGIIPELPLLIAIAGNLLVFYLLILLTQRIIKINYLEPVLGLLSQFIPIKKRVMK